MGIGGIGGVSSYYPTNTSYKPGSMGAANGGRTRVDVSAADSADGTVIIKNPGQSQVKQAGRKSSPAECEACSNRKYQDGSDEMVSFKSPAHVSPNAAASAVRAHEGEHVSNAYKKAAENNGEVVQASVRIKTAICPECGRSYVSGGETTTQIKYFNEDNPYQKDKKAEDAIKYTGMNVDIPA